MRQGYKIIDADRHVLEPIDLWQRYLPEALRQHAPYHHEPPARESLEERAARLGADALVPVWPEIHVSGEPIWHNFSERAGIALARVGLERRAQTERGVSPEGQLLAMDEEGVDIAFLFPTLAQFVLAMDVMEAPVAAALAGAYNAWLRDFCAVDAHRLRGIGVVSRHDPVDMVEELERLVDMGFAAVVLRPNPIQGRILGHPDYEPFWQACVRHSIAVCVHEGTHARVPSAGADRFHSRFALHACSHPMEQMMALLALIEGGVLERHPTLRVGFFESGCGWLPYWLWRLDDIEYASLAAEVRENVCMKPSAYFRRQCFIAFEPEEPYLPAILELIGAERLLFGTDFPHYDHDSSIVDHALELSGRVPEAALRAILWNNPARFFGME